MGVLWGTYAQHMPKAQPGSSIGLGLGAQSRIRPDEIGPVLSCVPVVLHEKKLRMHVNSTCIS